MDKSVKLQELLVAYKKWVISNPNLVTDVETLATWSSYFVAGKINKSPLVSELVFCVSKLLSLCNDRLIRQAYGEEVPYYSLRQLIKVWLTVIHYCEVFVELVVKKQWGSRGKWTTVTLIQLFKCSSALILLYRFKQLPIAHPPIPALQRRKFTEGKTTDENANAFLTLPRSGRVIRRVDGAPPVAFRDWQTLKIKDESFTPGTDVRDLIYAETLHILKPLIHLAAMRIFGNKVWMQWLVAFGLDIASLRLFNRHKNMLSHEQRLELSRRKLSLVLYLLRSPMYNRYSKNVIESTLKSSSNKIQLMSFINGPIIQYLNHWQDIYFYMWAS